MDFNPDGDDGDEPNEFAELAGGADSSHPDSQKDCVLFLIDARAPMCVQSGDGPSPLAQALGCVQSCMKDRLYGGDSDLVGVLLYGTAKTKLPDDQQQFPHVYQLQEIDQPNSTGMRELQQLIETGAYDAFGSCSDGDGFDFATILWAVSSVFNWSTRNVKNHRRRVYVITNDDNPCGASQDARRRALTRAGDLGDGHVWIEPFFMAGPNGEFDLSGPGERTPEGSFWRALIKEVREKYRGPVRGGDGGAGPSDGGDDAQRDDAEDRSDGWLASAVCAGEEALMGKVRRTAHRKRTTGRMPFVVGGEGGCKMWVTLVSLWKPWSRPAFVKMYGPTNEPLNTATTHTDGRSGEQLQESDMWRGFNFGGQWVYFEKWELQQFEQKESGATGLELFGFKPRDALALHHNLEQSVFAEPSEQVPGSVVAMAALVDAMAEKGVVGIGRLKKGVSLRLVAMLPQKREVDEATGATTMACGLHLVRLPYADEMREPSMGTVHQDYSDAQKEAAHELVNAMSVAKPLVAALPNPTMHKCLNHVQALAIAKADAEVVADATMPDASLWADGADAASQAFLDAFEVSEVAEPPAKKARSAGGGGSSGARAEKAPLPTTDDEWLDAHRRGAIAGFTNKVLQDFCISKVLKKTGKKDDLVARVTEYLDGMEREHGGDTSADAGADAGADADDAAENEVRDGAAVPTPTTSGESGTAARDDDLDF